MRRSLVLFVIVVAGAVGAVFGQAPQGGPPPAMLTIEQIKPGLYAILNPGANTLAVRVTNEGVLIVDDMFERNYEDIIRLVKTVTDQPVKYVISTHHHGDHTGGNGVFRPTARKILAHANVPRLQRAAAERAASAAQPGVTSPAPAQTYADTLFETAWREQVGGEVMAPLLLTRGKFLNNELQIRLKLQEMPILRTPLLVPP